MSINRSAFSFECLSDARTFVWRKWVFGQNRTLSTILREYVYWEGRCWLMQPHSVTTVTRCSERLQCSSALGIKEASVSLPSTWVTSRTQTQRVLSAFASSPCYHGDMIRSEGCGLMEHAILYLSPKSGFAQITTCHFCPKTLCVYFSEKTCFLSITHIGIQFRS